MTEHTTTPGTATIITARPTATPSTPALLACGVVAGPLFAVVAAIQVLTRDRFDLARHPLSLLSLGELGWIQITSFVLAGALVVAAAVGMRRACIPTGPERGDRSWSAPSALA
jgi:hypothetical protein